MFTYEEYQVKPPHTFFIKKLWKLSNLGAPPEMIQKSILPNGCFNIALIAGEGLRVRHRGTEMYLTSGVYCCGQMTEALDVDILPGNQATMIQLHPWTPVHFAQADMSLYTDRIVPINQLIPGVADFDPLASKGRQGYAAYIRYVVRSFAPSLLFSPASRAITQSVQLILDSRGEVKMAEIAANQQCSLRYLQKIFKKHIGLTPKQLSLIIKLRTAVDGIAYPDPDVASLTQIALLNQFYDQAHFTNTFQAIVKKSPRSFHAGDYLLSFKN